jgi:hypothetical protein
MEYDLASSPYEVQRNTGNRFHEIPDSASSIRATRSMFEMNKLDESEITFFMIFLCT